MFSFISRGSQIKYKVGKQEIIQYVMATDIKKGKKVRERERKRRT